MRKTGLIVLIGLIGNWGTFFDSSFGVFAAEKFSQTADIVYKIYSDGATTVTQDFFVTNLTSDFVPEEFNGKLTLPDFYSLRAYDRFARLPIELTGKEGEKGIKVKFPRPPTGLNQSFVWTLSFETTAIAKRAGEFWEILIPPPLGLDSLSDFTLSVYLPTALGKNVYLQPAPTDSNPKILRWTKKELGKEGVFAIFDPKSQTDPRQTYRFLLKYFLFNPKLYPALIKIALPPETNHQKLFLQNLSPTPVNVEYQESSGNYFATYLVGPAAWLEILAEGKLQVAAQPFFSPPAAAPPLSQKRKVTGLIISPFTKQQATNWEEEYQGRQGLWQAANPMFNFNYIALALGTDHGLFLPREAKIDFSEEETAMDEAPKIGLRPDIPARITAGFPAEATIYLENYGPAVFKGEIIGLEGELVGINPYRLATEVIPPLGHKVFEIPLIRSPFWKNEKSIIMLKFGKTERRCEVSVRPIYANSFILTISVLLIFGLTALTAQVARGLFILRQRR